MSDSFPPVAAPVNLERRLTPSAGTYTYSVRAWQASGTGTVTAGAGGTATFVPGYISILQKGESGA